ncbi:TlpA family protein disulfide reductase [Salinimicrobium flavum]|uniref:TlpA family protein disulfide reductase n=1 Tax=Salinimicrobium flavum TaxID=1737065 RepID=A0ABW5IZY6_9FLAO
MSRLILLFIFFISVSVFGQHDQVSFSEAISTHLPKYKIKANKAYRTHNVERAEFLFDSLVNYCLKGSKLDNFKVRDLKKKVVQLDEFKKPVYLITYASWVIPTEGEIPALNKLAAKYNDQVDFVILFWDNRTTTKELAKKYHKNIKVLYVDEMQNNSSYVVKMMKHSLGFPTTFLLDKEKRITDIRRSVSHPYGIEFERSFDLNYDSFSKAISLLLINESSRYSNNTKESLTP